MYLIESSSPLLPGARPSKSSDASVLMWASIPSGVIASRPGFNFSSWSAAKVDAAPSARMTSVVFINSTFPGGISHRLTQIFTDEQKDSESVFHPCPSVEKSFRFVRRPGRFLFFVRSGNADLFQE